MGKRWMVVVLVVAVAVGGLAITVFGSTAAMEYLLTLPEGEMRRVSTALLTVAAVVIAAGSYAKRRAAREARRDEGVK